ncbi:GNAT family N-acetyltransferase [Agreia sp.]|uniref:GNAT family N-acetyltransferase n=1 Tax=Agreia sp. TaxID=1872416 RepID=UPI0035BBC6AC
MTLTTRYTDVSDLSPLLDMNNRAIPAVNLLDESELLDLVSMAHAAVVVVDDESPDEPLGLVVTLAAGNDYDSENYRWFDERGGDFLYVDRIVVAEGMRGRGLGQILYERVFAEAELAGLTEVTCEVNLDPPNPGSLAFHDRLGFVQLGEQVTKGGSVKVALLSAPVFPASDLPDPS